MIYLPAGPTTFTKPGLSPLESKSIDTKIDDGYPTTGTIISRDPTTFSNSAAPSAGAAGTASAGDCGDTDTTPTSYNIGALYANIVACSISIRMQ